ncbi:hypothetical protein QUC31_013823 [Theobroma cacao]
MPKTSLPELLRVSSLPFQFSSFSIWLLARYRERIFRFFHFLGYRVERLVDKWRLVLPLNVPASASNEVVGNNVWSQQQRTFIQMRTVLKVVDNSGAKKVMCIQALKGKKGARLGDTIVASVKEAMPNGKVKKGKVVYGVVVRAAMQRGRCDGSEVKFDDNAVVLVDKQGQPIGTRVFGPVPHELRNKKHVKILTLAKHIA